MLTTSIVVYKTQELELQTVVDCALDSTIDTIYIVDNSPESLAGQMQNVINGNLNLFKSCPSINIEMPTVNSWQELFDLLLK